MADTTNGFIPFKSTSTEYLGGGDVKLTILGKVKPKSKIYYSLLKKHEETYGKGFPLGPGPYYKAKEYQTTPKGWKYSGIVIVSEPELNEGGEGHQGLE